MVITRAMSGREEVALLAHWRMVLGALTPHHDDYGGASMQAEQFAPLTAAGGPLKTRAVAQRSDRVERAERAERADAPRRSAPPRPQQRIYGTLSDLPPVAMTDIESLNEHTCARFKHYNGVVYWGPISPDWPQNGYWGEKLVLASQETLQMRFWPKDAFTSRGDPSGTPLAEVVYVSTRVLHNCGRHEVHTAVLFKPGGLSMGEDIELVDATNATRICSCRGMHLMLAGLYKRHNFTVSGVRAGMGMTAQDSKGHEAIRSSTYSIFPKDRKDLHKSSDHHNASGASAGPSVLAIANEFRDQLLDLDGSTRCAEPISRRKFRDQLTDTRRDLCPDGDKKAADDAISSAMACVELLSAEGLMGLLANPFFDGALPDRLVGPHGLGLSIALACRLATDWDKHGLPKPSACDMYANDQFKVVWNTAGFSDLPMPDRGVWAIDLVLRAGLQRSEEECNHVRDHAGASRLTESHIVNDHKVFWQRLGQGVITRLFGLGASPAASMTKKNLDGMGKPWRLSDPGQYARDYALTNIGVGWEGVDEPLIPLAAPGPRKTAFVRLMLGVEKWLRTGQGPEGRSLATSNAEGRADDAERHSAYIDVLSRVMLPRLLQSSLTNGEQVTRMTASVLDTQMNYAAFDSAVNNACVLMVHGPMLHLTHNVGAYIVAPKQELTCTECNEKVHVLTGVMFSNTYGECSACHSRRCLACANSYGKAIDFMANLLQKNGKSGPVAVGRACRKCGAEPAKLSMHYTVEADGRRSSRLQLGDRVRKEKPQPWAVELRSGGDNAFGDNGGGPKRGSSPVSEEPAVGVNQGVTTPGHTQGGSNTSSRSAKKRGGRR